MKHGSFITKNEYQATYIERIKGRNNRGVTLEPGDGILNIKKEFSVCSGVKSIVLRATALDVFRLYVNGKRVGKNVGGKTVYDEMNPGWTDYRFRVFEVEYDITDLCGENNVFVCDIASGWWNGRISYGMNSFNHYAYCAVAEWFYSGICGINPNPEKPAFESFILAPNPDFRKTFPTGQSRINSAYATYDSRAGRIESGWYFEGEGCIYDFVIPMGSTAKVSLISDSDSVCVNGNDVSSVRNGEHVEFVLSGGRYTVSLKN